MTHEGNRRRRDIYAELIHHTTLRRAIAARGLGLRQFAAQVDELSYSRLSHLVTGISTQTTPELAHAIEAALRLESGSLFELKVRYAAARARRSAITAARADSDSDSEDVA